MLPAKSAGKPRSFNMFNRTPKHRTTRAYTYTATTPSDLVSICALSGATLTAWDGPLIKLPSHNSLVKCLYCGRLNQYDPEQTCPGCGAPAQALLQEAAYV